MKLEMENLKTLPEPNGEYKVGITQKEFSYVGINQDSRKLSVIIFYPIDNTEGKKIYPYAFPELFAGIEAYATVSDTITHCFHNAELSRKEDNYPVIIYNHGYGSYEMSNTILCSDLASKGFIVVCPGHPKEAYAIKYLDGSVVKMNSKSEAAMSSKELMDNLTPVLDQIMDADETDDELLVELSKKFFSLQDCFNVRMDDWVMDTIKTADFVELLNRGSESIENNHEADGIFKNKMRLELGIGLTGHSYGGATSLQSAMVDKRFVCCINIDGGDFGNEFGVNVGKPLMIIGNPGLSKMLRAVYLNNSKDSYSVSALNSDHLGFTDFLFIMRDTKGNNRLGSREPYSFRDLITEYSLSFFNKYLLGKDVKISDLKYDDIIYRERLNQ